MDEDGKGGGEELPREWMMMGRGGEELPREWLRMGKGRGECVVVDGQVRQD